ncbi:MAG: MFS transporter [Novosphingobium sp.]|nr:MFS transporter [Novosphingobium sp.]
MPALPNEGLFLSKRYKRWLVFVLLVVSIFNFADRAIIAVLAQPIKEDLRLTDTDLGILQGLGFAILYSVLGVPIGWLAERMSRTRMIAVTVAVWSVMTALCGLASSFTTLLLGRIGVGIGEAGALPLSSSLQADHFKPERRASIAAIVALGSPFGFLLGQSLGGWIASEWNWRVAFFALGFPGLLVALLVTFTLREPPRGLADGRVSDEPPPSLGAVLRYLAAKPTYLHLLAAYAITGLTFNAVATFVLPFYLRSFDLPLATLGALFGLVSLTSNGLGMLVGGFGFDRLAKRDARWSLWGPAIALVLSMPLYFGAFASTRVAASLAFVWCANFVLITYFAPTSGTLQNLVGPRMRAMSSSLVFLVVGIFGAGLGPTIVGIASDFFARRAFGGNFIASCPGGHAPSGAAAAADAACRAASTIGLRYALIAMLIVFLWGAVHFFLAARTLKRDLYAAEAARDTAAGV